MIREKDNDKRKTLEERNRNGGRKDNIGQTFMQMMTTVSEKEEEEEEKEEDDDEKEKEEEEEE